ncbi:hypothetical protein LXL04_005831 [Taraxacum kok-saghyz]
MLLSIRVETELAEERTEDHGLRGLKGHFSEVHEGNGSNPPTHTACVRFSAFLVRSTNLHRKKNPNPNWRFMPPPSKSRRHFESPATSGSTEKERREIDGRKSSHRNSLAPPPPLHERAPPPQSSSSARKTSDQPLCRVSIVAKVVQPPALPSSRSLLLPEEEPPHIGAVRGNRRLMDDQEPSSRHPLLLLLCFRPPPPPPAAVSLVVVGGDDFDVVRLQNHHTEELTEGQQKSGSRVADGKLQHSNDAVQKTARKVTTGRRKNREGSDHRLGEEPASAAAPSSEQEVFAGGRCRAVEKMLSLPINRLQWRQQVVGCDCSGGGDREAASGPSTAHRRLTRVAGGRRRSV